MNIIDDFTSKHWLILLQNKANVFPHLEIQEKLGIYRTEHNSELEGHRMEAWLLSQGNEQQYGATYTSAHIGHV